MRFGVVDLVFNVFKIEFRSETSSETQGQLEGAGKKLGRRKVKNAEKSPWGQSFNGPVPKRQGSSGF